MTEKDRQTDRSTDSINNMPYIIEIQILHILNLKNQGQQPYSWQEYTQTWQGISNIPMELE